MRNFQIIRMQECGIVLIAVILIFLLGQKNLRDYKQRLYMWVVGITSACLILDVISVTAIMHMNEWPQGLIDIAAKAYTSSLIWAGWASYVYMMYAALPRQKYKWAVMSMAILNIVINIVSGVLPIYTYYDGKACYSYGLSNLIIYSGAGIYVLIIFVSCLAFRKTLNKRYRFSMFVWDLIIVVSGTVQFLYPKLLLVSFGLALGCLVLFIVQENPQSNIDRTLGCFNSYAFHGYINYLFQFKKIFSAERIYLDGDRKRHGGAYPSHQEIKSLCDRLGSLENIFVFKDNDYSLLIIAKDASTLDSMNQNLLFPTITAEDKIDMNDILRIDYFGDIESSVQLMNLFDFVRESEKTESDQIIKITSVQIKNYKDSMYIEKEIDDALADDRVEVFYQPIFNYEINKFTAAEALCRIRKTDGTLMPPGLFIPVAEKSNQIVRLGERVIEKTCQMIKSKDVARLGIKYIEINLSVVQCEDDDFAKDISNIVEKYDVEPSMINWEITETASIRSRDKLLDNLTLLVNKGFKFSLDDFGKGQSNLMYIVEMPVSIVKLDMDMTKAFFTSNKAKEVLRTVVRMVHRLGLKIVCEGVEDEIEAETLYYENVDYIQGYYYSRPLPVNEFIDIIKQVRKNRF